MPDQTVNVSFDPAANPQFVFEPDEVTMTARGKVIFHRRGSSPTWTFTGGTVKDDPLKQFSASVQGQGRSLHIDDEFRDREKTAYEYTISVQLDGRSYTSPDPVIVNDPGS